MDSVGIYAGSFDPVHEGHLAFARQAIKDCKLKKVYFLIEPTPRRKQGVKSFDHRLQMLQLAVDNKPDLGVIMLDQNRFTVTDTLPLLLARFKGMQLHMLVGDDVAWHLAEWPHIEELTMQVNFIIGHRKTDMSELKMQIEDIKKSKGLSFNYNILDTKLSSISSTEIRLKLKRGQDPKGLLTSTKNYIRDNGLYSSQDKGAEA